MGNQILGMTTFAQSKSQVSQDGKTSAAAGVGGFPFFGQEGEVTKTHDGKPCRACTDFKSWARLQTLKRSEESSSSHSGADDRNTSFEDVRNVKLDTQMQPQHSRRLTAEEEEYEALLARRAHLQCPLDKDELGRSTWSFLHTMAAYYPDNPNKTQQKEMSAFMKIFAKYYPCEHCAQDFQKSIKVYPPETNSRNEFVEWMCKRHNEVNRKLGKPEFDCGKVDERWKDGWKDESCDM